MLRYLFFNTKAPTRQFRKGIKTCIGWGFVQQPVNIEIIRLVYIPDHHQGMDKRLKA
jgi:hypothetical protein